jgi:hypothetical protein
MSDFRGPLPLDDRDFADVRRNVLGRIDKHSPLIPLTLAAAAVIALVILLIPRQPAAPPKSVVRRPSAPVIVLARTAPPPAVEVAVAEKPKPKQKSKPQPQFVASPGAPPSDSEITMNIETADPNVRIIWISR